MDRIDDYVDSDESGTVDRECPNCGVEREHEKSILVSELGAHGRRNALEDSRKPFFVYTCAVCGTETNEALP